MYKYVSSITLLFCILFIMGSAMWSPGGILLLDYLATPYRSIDFFQNAWDWFPQIVVNMIGFEWGTKLVFLMILCVSAWLGVLFGRKASEWYAPKHREMLSILGGIFFLANPFAYERMMTQPVIYLGIILIGYMTYSLLFVSGYKKWIFAGISGAIAINLFLHASFMMAFILGLYILFFVRTKKEILGLFGMTSLMFILNLNWIFAMIFSVTTPISNVNGFDISNFEAFQTNALAPMNVWFTNIFLYGFWGENYRNHFINATVFSSFWYVGGGIFMLVILCGMWRLFREKIMSVQKKIFWMFSVISVVSLIFGIGIASPMLQGGTLWMIEHIPMWQGYREPQKWIGLLMITEGFFLLVGMALIIKKYAKKSWSILGIIFLLFSSIFYIWSPGSFAGYQGQLRTTVYPEDYFRLKEKLFLENALDTKEPILALPWHAYIGCSWTGRPTVATPIEGLMYPFPLIRADNIEVGKTLYSNSSDVRSQMIESAIRMKNVAPLSSAGIRNILLMKECADAKSYDWVGKYPGCEKTFSGRYVDFFQCQ